MSEDDWENDERPILRASLGDEQFDTRVGDRFERMKRAGEYCYVPWLRIESGYHNGIQIGYLRTIEAPLNRVTSIEFGKPA